MSSLKVSEIKPQYGHLLERYFTDLLQRIFGKLSIRTAQGDGEPDAILETADHIVIFEFTVEYYRFASLYSEDTKLFIEDIHRLLFNEGRSGQQSRKKKDKGKFIKLNGYIEKMKNKKKTIIPVLVTENHVGDCDVLEKFDRCISENIASKNLTNLKDNLPIILNLDDLEVFWNLSNKKKAKNQFVDLLNQWRSLQTKGHNHFSFSSFLSESFNKEDVKNDFNKFFSWGRFIDQLNEISDYKTLSGAN